VVLAFLRSRTFRRHYFYYILLRWHTHSVWILRLHSSTVGRSQWCLHEYFEGHTSSVTSVTFFPDNKRIVSGSWDTTLRLWDVVSDTQLHTLKGQSAGVASLTFSPGWHAYHVWILGLHTSTVDAISGAHLHILKGHSRCVVSSTFSPDSKRIVSGSWTILFDCGMQSVVPI